MTDIKDGRRNNGGARIGSGRKSMVGNRLDAFGQVYGMYKFTAKKKQLGFLLSPSEFEALISADCFYCDAAPANKCTNGRGHTIIYNGIDRLDNTLGYTVDNCVSCCRDCNIAKNKRSRIDFINWAHRITKRHPITEIE